MENIYESAIKDKFPDAECIEQTPIYKGLPLELSLGKTEVCDKEYDIDLPTGQYAGIWGTGRSPEDAWKNAYDRLVRTGAIPHTITQI